MISNLEGKFTFNSINYDQANGLGSTPINQNILYRGIVAIMPMHRFMSLAENIGRGQEKESLAFLEDQINAGAAIASPFLLVDFETGHVRGHEGRHRCLAIMHKYHPKWEIVVQLHSYGGGRARHITEDQVRDFSYTPISQDGLKLHGPTFEDYYHINGWKKVLKPGA